MPAQYIHLIKKLLSSFQPAVLFLLLITYCCTARASDPSSSHSSIVVTDKLGFRYIRPVSSEDKIVLDGILDETDWHNATFQNAFTQREPSFGRDASEETQVAILSDNRNLYIGIRCYAKNPETIIAREMRRDARLDDDDHFEIVIDTYRDRRNGYYFAVNPKGAMTDASFGDEGNSYNRDWDGIWDCGAEINEQGWFAEVAIPWKTLRFADADSATWGLNFARTIRSQNEEVYWQLVSRDAGRFGLYRLSEAGTLRGLTGMNSGGNLEIKPYLLGGMANDLSTNYQVESAKNFGIDSKIGLTSNLAVHLTWNTDFAQVESDQEQVNLTRFSLFFPEKREFFLDGAEVFNFGGQSLSGRRGSGNGIRLFYSRRIGIVDGFQQPITGGIKATGKAGKFQIGLLNMVTREFSAVDDDDDEVYIPSNNFSVVRVKREMFKRAYLGFMMLNSQQISGRQYNRSGGIDAYFPLNDRFTISGAVAGTYGPNVDDESGAINMKRQNYSGNINFEYNSDLWDFEVSHLDVQRNFNAEMGFMRRTDIRSTHAEIDFSPRPKNIPAIRQFRFRLETDYITDHNNTLLETDIGGFVGARFQNSAYIYTGMRRIAEFIDEDWEVRQGFIIPSRRYWGWSNWMWLSSDESKPLSGTMRMTYSDYYTGHRLSVNPGARIMNFDRFQAELDVGLNHVALPQGSFDAQTFGCRLLYFFSTKLYLKAYLQLNDDRLANDGDRISLANVLFRWIYRPGSDIYLVYNEGRLFGPTGMRTSNRTVMLKTTFFWRK